MSDTPRTDAHCHEMESEDFDVELAKTYTLARQLERELAEAKADKERLISGIEWLFAGLSKSTDIKK